MTEKSCVYAGQEQVLLIQTGPLRPSCSWARQVSARQSSQGPALAWHTLSALNNTDVLLFGGLPDSNSQTVIVTLPDSAALLNVYSRTSPSWFIEPSSWAGDESSQNSVDGQPHTTRTTGELVRKKNEHLGMDRQAFLTSCLQFLFRQKKTHHQSLPVNHAEEVGIDQMLKVPLKVLRKIQTEEEEFLYSPFNLNR